MSNQVPSNGPQNSGAEEIDLGQLFKMIGDAFTRLFNFIGNIFKGLFHLLVSFLLFIQKHFVKFVTVAIVGGALGTYLDYIKEPVYVSSMVVEPNFESVQQLYNNINFYNELARANDSLALSEALGIKATEAATIKEFKVDSYSDENQKVQLFDEFVRSLDSTTQKNIDIQSFLENFNSLDARFHNISIRSTNSTIAKELQESIINSISNNQYYLQLKDAQMENIGLQRELLTGQLTEIDSLQRLYKNVMLKEADKPLQGTNISLGEKGTNQQSREMELINKIDEIKEQLVELKETEVSHSNILNIISEFPRRGVEEKGFFISYKFMFPAFFIGVLLFVLGLIEVNKYLKTYNATVKKQA